MIIYHVRFFFFFSSRRRHTRYIGDWSSDVCSSDLLLRGLYGWRSRHLVISASSSESLPSGSTMRVVTNRSPIEPSPLGRSEERRVGKECRSRGSPYP